MKTFKVGDHVQWNSEAGMVSGTILRKLTSDTVIKGYTHHASGEQPQYIIRVIGRTTSQSTKEQR